MGWVAHPAFFRYECESMEDFQRIAKVILPEILQMGCFFGLFLCLEFSFWRNVAGGSDGLSEVSYAGAYLEIFS